jgi:hypothetical protein
MDYKQAFHEAYCAQQGLACEEDCHVPHDQLLLLHETKRAWVVLNEEEGTGIWLNVVAKETTNGQREMETIEL